MTDLVGGRRWTPAGAVAGPRAVVLSDALADPIRPSHRDVATDPVAVLDLGGTWLRAAIHRNGALQHVVKRPAVTRWRHPGLAAAQLVPKIVQQLAAAADELTSHDPRIRRVGVSIGAALDERTGHVVGSGPLFGDMRVHVLLGEHLHAAAPCLEWTVVNDVTAAALQFADENPACRRVAALVVGTGIALRTVEPATRRIAVDSATGLQGEIGHVPSTMTYRGVLVEGECQCGRRNHLAAFCSGAGLAALLSSGVISSARRWGASVEQFAAAVARGETEALDLLAAATRPLGQALLTTLTVDPHIERIGLVGGVADGLGSAFLDTLRSHLSDWDFYGSAGVVPHRLRQISAGDDACLMGAAQAVMHPYHTS